MDAAAASVGVLAARSVNRHAIRPKGGTRRA